MTQIDEIVIIQYSIVQLVERDEILCVLLWSIVHTQYIKWNMWFAEEKTNSEMPLHTYENG